MSLFKGCAVAMVTPFNEKGVNYEMTEYLLEEMIDKKVNAIVALGTTGEASTMTFDEKIEFLNFIVHKTASRLPIIAGSGGNNTAAVAEYCHTVQNCGVDALLIVTPYYNKCTQNGLYAHYAGISKAVHIPIIAYNVPSRTGLNILPQTALKISELPNIIGIKEASGNMAQIQETLRLTEGKMEVFAGDDAFTAAAMFMGASGVISVAANIVPDLMSALTKSCLDGNWLCARELQLKLLPLINALFSEVNPIPVKKALQFLGHDCGIPRLPLTEMEKSHAQILYDELVNLRRI